MGNDTRDGSPSSAPDVAPLQPDSPLRLAFDEAFKSDWRAILKRSGNGRTLSTLENVYHILIHDENWRSVIGFNEHSCCVVTTKPPPFGAQASASEWTDDYDHHLALWLSIHYGIEPKERVMATAVRTAADRNRFHPVRQKLAALAWDERPRLRYWLQAYLGAEPVIYTVDGREVEYTDVVGTKFLVGAVARVMEPGCKQDHVLILEGVQGIGKSSAMGVLFDPWCTDQQIKIGEKDTYEVMRGQWVIELPELDALSKAEVASAKAFFSRSRDRFRSFYGRRAATVPRQTVFVGTVNHFQYLRDASGNRRYWPVRCHRVDLADLAEEKDQLWAEALHLYRQGVSWWVLPQEAAMFQEEQEKRYVGDAWEERIRHWLEEAPQGQFEPRNECTTSQILSGALGMDPSKWSHAEQTRVGIVMERIGWPARRPWFDGALRQRVYVRPKRPK